MNENFDLFLGSAVDDVVDPQAMYDRLFSWIVSQVNAAIDPSTTEVRKVCLKLGRLRLCRYLPFSGVRPQFHGNWSS